MKSETFTEASHPASTDPTGRPADSAAIAAARSPWLTVVEAAERARCGPKLIYREVRAGRLRAARVGGRRELRLLPEWIDDWLLQSTTIRPA